MLRMLRSVVASAVAARLGDVWLATSEPAAAEIAVTLGISTVSDGDLPWNDGLVHALHQLNPRPAVLYLAGDLPLVTAAEIVRLVDATPPRGVAIARARDGGTNALCVRPPDVLAPRFGAVRSSLVHATAAAHRDVPWRYVDINGLALDVDTIEDLRDAGLTATYSVRPHPNVAAPPEASASKT